MSKQERNDAPRKRIARRGLWQRLGQAIAIPALALLTALIISGVFIVVSDPNVWQAFEGYLFNVRADIAPGLDQGELSDSLRESFARQERALTPQARVEVEEPGTTWILVDTDARYEVRVHHLALDVYGPPNVWRGLAQAGESVGSAYLALLVGSFGDPTLLVKGIGDLVSTGNTRALRNAFDPLSESLTAAAPYIFAGLAVALGFRCGLFNIGAEGQIFIGALASAYVGYAEPLRGLPVYIHLPLALLAGGAAGAAWAAIPGLLKAWRGAHEVINTIMMNYIAFRLADYLLTGPMKRPGHIPITRMVEESAKLPLLFPGGGVMPDLRFHAGFFLALAVAGLVYWFLWKTTLGFEIRTVGANPRAARYAGISVPRNIVLAMALSGALAGLAGTNEVLGVNYYMAQAFSSGYGFDSIALALLGRSHPLGVVLAALLWGFLRAGAIRMQSRAAVPYDIIFVIQAFVIAFVAAPEMVRWLYRIRRAPRETEEAVFTRGWGG